MKTKVFITALSMILAISVFGRAYSAPYGGDVGIKAVALMDNYKVDYKGGKSYSIAFSSKGTDDTYQFSILFPLIR